MEDRRPQWNIELKTLTVCIHYSKVYLLEKMYYKIELFSLNINCTGTELKLQKAWTCFFFFFLILSWFCVICAWWGVCYSQDGVYFKRYRRMKHLMKGTLSLVGVFIVEKQNSSGANLGKIFAASVKFVWCKDRHKTHNASQQTIHFKWIVRRMKS